MQYHHQVSHLLLLDQHKKFTFVPLRPRLENDSVSPNLTERYTGLPESM